MPKKILIVDDEKNIVDIIAFNLKREGFDTISAYDGEEGLRLAFSENPDLILLDIMMPKIDGFDVCKMIRQKSQTPIIMLTARAEEIDKVMGLTLGADDYVTKPFSVKELVARVKANIRRTEPVYEEVQEEAQGDILQFGEISINDARLEIFKRGELVDLTRREFDLVRFLAVNNTQIFTREELLERVWGYEYLGDVRTVDVTVRRLRTKLEDNPEKPKYIVTKRSVGYCFGNV